MRSALSFTYCFFKDLLIFVTLDEPRKGALASCSIITRWLWQTIIQAYSFQGLGSKLSCQGTILRPVSASWASRHQVSVSQICKIAAWVFYQLDVVTLSDASFGHMVLQATPCFLLFSWACESLLCCTSLCWMAFRHPDNLRIPVSP